MKIFLSLVLLLGLTTYAQAESEEVAESTKRCISVSRIQSVKVIDKTQLRFKMAAGPDYINVFPRKCVGLRKHDPIMYKVSINKLCDLDSISQLRSIGNGYMEGPRCGLGKFVPVDEASEEEKEAE